MRDFLPLCLLILASGIEMKAAQTAAPSEDVIDKIISRELEVERYVQRFSPIVETYVQELSLQGNKLVPSKDHYFIGKADFSELVDDHLFEERGNRVFNFLNHQIESMATFSMEYLPAGFVAEVYPNPDPLDRQNYRFEYLGREFLGEVRCLIFQVTPSVKRPKGMFHGRIWVEDQDYTIVRFNGLFRKGGFSFYYFHFDSWRINVAPGIWVPALIYNEETDLPTGKLWKINVQKSRFKAQTRIWGYNARYPGSEEELGRITIDPSTPVYDETTSGHDLSPIQAQHAWERQAEDNVAGQLERVGLLAPTGEFEKTLQTVVNNLEVTNKLEIEPEVRCRVLLTSRLESFSLGHTMVISRGLIDVLPNEATLAAILAHELAHILLTDRIDTQFAFADRIIFSPRETFRRLNFVHKAKEEKLTEEEAKYLMKHSPYQDSLQSVDSFFAEVWAKVPHIRELLKSNLGDSLLTRILSANWGYSLTENKPSKQSRALPMGTRIAINPWTDRVEMVKSIPPDTSSDSDILPFEITPFILYLRRQPTNTAKNAIQSSDSSVGVQKP